MGKGAGCASVIKADFIWDSDGGPGNRRDALMEFP